MGSVPQMMIVNNYDRICCSNGCGGHTCYDSAEMCKEVLVL